MKMVIAIVQDKDVGGYSYSLSDRNSGRRSDGIWVKFMKV